LKLFWFEPIHIVNAIGLMGTGKTTLTLALAGAWEPDAVLVVWPEYLGEKLAEHVPRDARRVAIIVDDITFSFKSRGYDPRLAFIARVRHYLGAHRKYFISYNLHYVRGAPVFLRLSHTQIATSCVGRKEAEALGEFFRYAWDFCALWPSAFKRGVRTALINWLGEEWVERLGEEYVREAKETAKMATFLGPSPP
jgi:hypothetical protein